MEYNPSPSIHRRLLLCVDISKRLLLDLLTFVPATPAHVARLFHRQSRDINHFLQSNDSVTRTNYFRRLALASIDILLTLPVGIARIVLDVEQALALGPIPFYFGWTYDHTDWQPRGYSYAEMVAQGTSTVAEIYFTQWTSPILAFVIFALFGVTPEARASYWHIVCTTGGWFGWKSTPRAHRACSRIGDVEFGERPAPNSTSLGLECVASPSVTGYRLIIGYSSNTGLINRNAQAHERTPGEVESGVDKEIEEVRRSTDGPV